MNSDVRPRRSTRLRMKAYELPAGTPLEQPAPRTRPRAQRPTSASPSVLPLTRMAPPPSPCPPLMPRFIDGYHLPRSSTLLTRVTPMQTDGQKRATRSGCSSSSTIRRCAISFVNFYGTTFARKTLRSGSRFKTSNASSISHRPPAAQLSSVRHQNGLQAARATRQGNRRWNSTTSHSFNKRMRFMRCTLPRAARPS